MGILSGLLGHAAKADVEKVEKDLERVLAEDESRGKGACKVCVVRSSWRRTSTIRITRGNGFTRTPHGDIPLRSFNHLVCVDTSGEMLRLARAKLAGFENVHYVESDILEYFESPYTPCDVVMSTDAIHQLTEAEKTLLFREIAAVLAREGCGIWGSHV